MKHLKGLWPLAFVLLFPACSFLDPGPYKLNDGWRPGVVKSVGSASDLPMRGSGDCRAEPGAAYPADTPMALISYRSNRMTRYRVLPAPKETSFNEGDAVYMNVRGCDGALVIRAKQQ